MDASKYLERKQKPGSVQLQKLGPKTFQIVAKKYDSETGIETEPEIGQIRREQLVDQIARLDKDAENIAAARAGVAALLADIDALA